MTTFKTLILLFTTSIFKCFGQGFVEQTAIRLDSLPALNKIVKGIEKGYSVESAYIGEGGAPSDQWNHYEQLKKAGTIEQLIALTNHQNGAVRCYAFQALAAKHSDQLFPILIKHLNDTFSVETQNGCLGSSQFVGDYFIDVVTPNYVELDIYKLNQKELKILDSILLNDKSIRLSARSRVLKNLKPTAENYARIRQLVEEDRNEVALKALAKYQKQTDKALIASFFKDDNTQYSALCAVRAFPDEYFYPFVKNVFEQDWKETLYDYPKWRVWFSGTRKLSKTRTLELFEKTVKTKDPFKYETLCKYLLIAISKYPNPIYTPIQSQIKLSSYAMEQVKDELENNYESLQDVDICFNMWILSSDDFQL